MSGEALQQMMDGWLSNPAFLEELRQDLDGAVLRQGVRLTEHEWEILRSVDWSLHGEQDQTGPSTVSAYELATPGGGERSVPLSRARWPAQG